MLAQNPAVMRPPIKPKTAPIVPSIMARGIGGIRVIVFSSIMMHLRIPKLVTLLCEYKSLHSAKTQRWHALLCGLGQFEFFAFLQLDHFDF